MRRRIAARRAAARMYAETTAFPPMGQIGSIECRQLLVAELGQHSRLYNLPAGRSVRHVVHGPQAMVVPLLARPACGRRHEGAQLTALVVLARHVHVHGGFRGEKPGAGPAQPLFWKFLVVLFMIDKVVVVFVLLFILFDE